MSTPFLSRGPTQFLVGAAGTGTANCCLRTPEPIPLSSHFCPTSGLGPEFYLKGRWASVAWGIGMGSELQHSELQPGKEPSTAKKEGTICLSRQYQEGVGGSGDTGGHTVVSGSSSGPTLIMSTKCQDDPLLPWAQWTPVSESGGNRVGSVMFQLPTRSSPWI